MVLFFRLLVKIFSFLFRFLNKKRGKNDSIECLVIGYGGANNTGAEARTVEAIKQILNSHSLLSITLTTLDKNQTLRYIKENERLRVVQIHPIFIFSILKLVLKTDFVLLVEGSCFKDNFSDALLCYFMYAAELAQKLNKPTVAYAVDAGNMKKKNSKWAVHVANNMDLLITRTKNAADLLKNIGVKKEIKVTTDTAFTVNSEKKQWIKELFANIGIDKERPVVGIAFEELFWWPVVVDIGKAIRGVRKDKYKSLYYHTWIEDDYIRSNKIKQVIAGYSKWVEEKYNAQVVFFAMEALDIKPCKDVQNRIDFKTHLFDSNNYNAGQISAILRNLSWLVTCRYHALVLSMLGNVPIIGLAHDERIRTIMEELGLKDDYFIDYKDQNIFEKLRSKTNLLIENKEDISKTIQNAYSTYLSRMAKNEVYLKEFLKSKFSY